MKVGILGSGQLGQMLALAGIPLGLDFIFYDENPAGCASRIGQVYTNEKEFCEDADIYTYEFENASLSLAQTLEKKGKLFPGTEALKYSSHRIYEKTLFAELGIQTAPWRKVTSIKNLKEAGSELGFPFLLKTIHTGYDGKGQTWVHSWEDIQKAAFLFSDSANYIAEGNMRFKRELSLLTLRTHTGEVAHYPLTENVHRNGILYSSLATANASDSQITLLHEWTCALVKRLEYVGVLALEVFDCDGNLYANEFAPRVHNSGHWTIEGAYTSQFTNHMRAICNMPLGDTSARGYALMQNLVGELPQISGLGNLHTYGKSPRPGRKLGHITYVGNCVEDLMKMRDSLAGSFFNLRK